MTPLTSFYDPFRLAVGKYKFDAQGDPVLPDSEILATLRATLQVGLLPSCYVLNEAATEITVTVTTGDAFGLVVWRAALLRAVGSTGGPTSIRTRAFSAARSPIAARDQVNIIEQMVSEIKDRGCPCLALGSCPECVPGNPMFAAVHDVATRMVNLHTAGMSESERDCAISMMSLSYGAAGGTLSDPGGSFG